MPYFNLNDKIYRNIPVKLIYAQIFKSKFLRIKRKKMLFKDKNYCEIKYNFRIVFVSFKLHLKQAKIYK